MTSKVRRVGLLGGTFDPIHGGHLQLARAAQRALKLDVVYFAPAAHPWHKHPPQASFLDRFAMVALALAHHHDWIPVDIPSPRGVEPTFTIDQVRWMRQHHPNEDIYFIIGADSLLTLPTWKDYRKLLTLCHWVVLSRGGIGLDQIASVLPPGTVCARERNQLHLRRGTRLYWLGRFASSASSTQARRRLAAHRRLDAVLPAAVERYARRAHLYGYGKTN